MANELSGSPPGNQTGRQFLAGNKEFVETHLRALRTAAQICQIVVADPASRLRLTRRALQQLLENRDATIRIAATNALREIDPR